jgi:pimeloyl-ACP methyl ester carboxylesterase
VALGLIVLGLIPGIYADYQTSLILVAKRPKDLQKHRRIKRQVTWTRRVTPVFFQGYTRRHYGQHKTPVLYGRLYSSLRPNKRLVLYIHDQNRNFRQGIPLAEELVKRGFDVFLYDRQGHGASEGKIALQPSDESKDLGRAYRYLWRLYPKRWARFIAVIGEGTAGDIALFAANRHRNFKAIVSIRPTLDLEVALKKRFQRRKVPAFLANLTVKRVARVANFRYKWNAPLRRARYLRRTSVLLVSDQFSSIKDHKKFCRLKKGTCRRLRLSRADIESMAWSKFRTPRHLRLLNFLEQNLDVKETRLHKKKKKKIKARKGFRFPKRRLKKRKATKRKTTKRKTTKRKTAKRKVTKRKARKKPTARKATTRRPVKKPTARPAKARKKVPARPINIRKVILRKPLLRKTILRKAVPRVRILPLRRIPTLRKAPVRRAPVVRKAPARSKTQAPTLRKAAPKKPVARKQPIVRKKPTARLKTGGPGLKRNVMPAVRGRIVPRPPVLRLKQPILRTVPTIGLKRVLKLKTKAKKKSPATKPSRRN